MVSAPTPQLEASISLAWRAFTSPIFANEMSCAKAELTIKEKIKITANFMGLLISMMINI
jgi:hypothetical protein